jgi:Ca-activated chloride channel family protein
MLTFASPWLLLLLPLPLFVYWLSPKSNTPVSTALTLPFFKALLPYLRQPTEQSKSAWHKGMIYLSLIWLLLIIAAARPVYIGDAISAPSVAHNIMLAIDISGSMDIDDMSSQGQQISRLQAIKAVANQFIAQRQGDRLGLILFGTRAYLMTPMTYDRNIVSRMLGDASVGLAGPTTAIGDAIGLAVKKLQALPEASRVLILLTDGVNNSGNLDPIAAARLAHDYHVKIYTIGFGASQMAVPTFFGTHYVNPSADLDENALKQIATLTGGMYFRATNISDLAQVYQAINALEPVSASQPFRPQQELYPLPISLALLLSIYLAWRRSGLSVKRFYIRLGSVRKEVN